MNVQMFISTVLWARPRANRQSLIKDIKDIDIFKTRIQAAYCSAHHSIH